MNNKYELEDLADVLADLEQSEAEQRAKRTANRRKQYAAMSTEQKNAEARATYARNRDKLKAKTREWQKANPDKLAEYNKKTKAKSLWDQKNKDKRKQYQAKFQKKRLANMTPEQREKKRAAWRAWNERNKLTKGS